MNSDKKKTKIIATLGPSTKTQARIKELAEAGVDVFRLNFSHGNHEEFAKTIKIIRAISKSTAKSLAIMADLQGPKIRLGDLPEDGQKISRGEELVFTTSKEKQPNGIYIKYKNFVKDIQEGEKILIDDGKIMMEVIRKLDDDSVLLKAQDDGILFSRKGVNLPFTNITLPALRKKDKKDLEFAISQNVDWIALSFVRSAENLRELKTIIGNRSNNVKVIAKIEKPQALEDIDAIIAETDALMMARGDLGVEIPLEQVPLIQKKLVKKCIEKAKPVIIATQMMDSMIENPTPTRAEITDVANAIIDGADAVMLSGETAIGKHPAKVVRIMSRIINGVESGYDIFNKELLPAPGSQTFYNDAICYNACKLARDVDAQAVIGMTRSGYTAFMLSSYRPKANIYIFTDNPKMLNILSLVWGVSVFYYDNMDSTDETIADIHKFLIDQNLQQKGDVVINTASIPIHTQGRTNMIKISIL